MMWSCYLWTHSTVQILVCSVCYKHTVHHHNVLCVGRCKRRKIEEAQPKMMVGGFDAQVGILKIPSPTIMMDGRCMGGRCEFRRSGKLRGTSWLFLTMTRISPARYTVVGPIKERIGRMLIDLLFPLSSSLSSASALMWDDGDCVYFFWT